MKAFRDWLNRWVIAAIAYVALVLGAGLSIMYNVLQTIETRKSSLEVWDIITAVAMPGVVVVMVHLFVSRLWVGQPWYMQTIRWLGCSAIGAVAMRASWTHGHAWLTAHGQTSDVATGWPLAIDALAIMATALLLASSRGQVATVATAEDVDTMASGQSAPVATVAAAEDVAISEDIVANPGHYLATRPRMATPPWVAELAEYQRDGHADPVATRPLSEPMPEDYDKQLAKDVDSWNAGLATPATLRAGRPVPDAAAAYLRAWDPVASGLSGKQVDALLAEYLGRSERTARGWRTTILGGPVSGPPQQ